jgi:hypothetical protein
LTIKIDSVALEKACKEIIETILLCLPNAYKGTVYRIGKPPKMVSKRITSGMISPDDKLISWGLPEKSDYNPPGKSWSEYRDDPGRPLEAMGWCVEKQKSWTAEDPKNDTRSLRLQIEGAEEDFHHMEPVLLRKQDLYGENGPNLPYPMNSSGEILWKDSEYVVVAVIKIHFKPNTIKIGSQESKVIKKLSRALGTELLSYQLKEQSIDAMRQLAEDKLESCNLLADTLRNAITKSGLIFSLIKLELAALRKQWEEMLLGESALGRMKFEAIDLLNGILDKTRNMDGSIKEELKKVQKKFLQLSLPPEPGEKWIKLQIEDRWEAFFRQQVSDRSSEGEVRQQIDQLKKSLYLGMDPDIVAEQYDAPDTFKSEWVALLYRNNERLDEAYLQRIIEILDDPYLKLPGKEKSKKSLIHLKTLAMIMAHLEENTNKVLRQVLNGSYSGLVTIR